MGLDRLQIRPKILFVTSHWPLANAYGAQQRVLNLGRLLNRFGEVSFVIVPTEDEEEEVVRRTKSEFKVLRVIRPQFVPPGKLLANFRERVQHELNPACMATEPYRVSQNDREVLQRLIQQHDLVWVHTIRVAQWFRIFRWPHSVLDVDDLPSRQYLSAASCGGSSRRLRNLRMSWIWRRRERMLAARFDVLAVCSEEDKNCLGSPERVHVIPNGAHPPQRHNAAIEGPPRIGLIGNCEFTPNKDGIKWFIRYVWPAVKHEIPQAQLRLVGRGSEGYLAGLGPDITGLGWLEDPGEEIASWSAMIVPIRVGGGTRVKVAEGFSRRCPVVATTVGAFGYDVKDGREILLANRTDDFASACIRLLRDPELRNSLSERAYHRFLERWSWNSFESTVGKVVQDCLVRSGRANRESRLFNKHLISHPLL